MNTRTRLVAAIATAAVLVLALANVAGASVGRNVIPVFAVPAFTPVPGAHSTLVRLDDGIAFAIHTSELTPGTPATLLVVIFNNPGGCSHGVQGLRCGEGDLVPGGPAEPSVVVAAEREPRRSGRFGAAGRIPSDDADDALFGPGLSNPSEADIHLVLQQNGVIVQASPHEV
jgi:hypothetical protein